jgi:signal transduction histidine kinase/CheY-like chemotaxis protein
VSWAIFVTGIAISLSLWAWLSAQQVRDMQSVLDSRARAYTQLLDSRIGTAAAALVRSSEWWTLLNPTPPQAWRNNSYSILRDFPYIADIERIDSDLAVRWHISRTEESWDAADTKKLTVVHRERINPARASGHNVISVVTDGDTPGSRRLDIFVPLRIGDTFDGYIRGSIDLNAVLKQTYDELRLVSNLRLFHDDQLIYEIGEAPITPGPTLAAATAQMEGHHIKIRAQLAPTIEFLQRQRSRQPLVVLGMMLLATAMIAALVRQYVVSQNQQSALQRSTTELSETKAEASAHIAHLENVYAIVPVGLGLLDTAQRYIYINERLAGVYGKSVEEHIGRTPREVLPAMANLVEPYINFVLENGAPLESIEITESEPAEEGDVPRCWVCSFHPAHDAEGVLNGVVMAILEITSLKEAEQEKHELNTKLYQTQKTEALGRLTGGVAHDFNNMLGVILGSLEFVKEKTAGDPETAKILARIELAAEHSAGLIGQLLAFARQQPMSPRNADVAQCMENLLPLLQRSIGETMEVRISAAPDLWQARVDISLLGSAVLNLVINARDAMPRGGKITIELANAVLDESYSFNEHEVTPGEYVAISVSDTGTGMPPEIVERVFEPFFTTKEGGKGTGLGLSMVFGFVKQSKGHIKIYSEVGHGTVVKMYLPRAAAGATAAVAAAPAPLPQGNEKILVLEDDTLVRETAVRQLSALGYTILEASNGAEALSLIDAHPDIDLLFSDVVMPGGLTGPDVAKAALAKRPGLKVLFVSGYTDSAMADHGWSSTTMMLLQKPYRRADLAAKVRKALSG